MGGFCLLVELQQSSPAEQNRLLFTLKMFNYFFVWWNFQFSRRIFKRERDQNSAFYEKCARLPFLHTFFSVAVLYNLLLSLMETDGCNFSPSYYQDSAGSRRGNCTTNLGMGTIKNPSSFVYLDRGGGGGCICILTFYFFFFNSCLVHL